MNTTGKLVFALVLAAGIAATGAAVKLDGHSRSAPSTPTIQLDAVVVTPANVQETIELAAVRVVPNQADRQYAKAHGISLPATTVAATALPTTIQLAAVHVTPSQADRQFLDARDPSGLAAATDSPDFTEAGTQVLMQAVAALGPGQFLNTSAALQALDALVFGGNGR